MSWIGLNNVIEFPQKCLQWNDDQGSLHFYKWHKCGRCGKARLIGVIRIQAVAVAWLCWDHKVHVIKTKQHTVSEVRRMKQKKKRLIRESKQAGAVLQPNFLTCRLQWHSEINRIRASDKQRACFNRIYQVSLLVLHSSTFFSSTVLHHLLCVLLFPLLCLFC